MEKKNEGKIKITPQMRKVAMKMLKISESVTMQSAISSCRLSNDEEKNNIYIKIMEDEKKAIRKELIKKSLNKVLSENKELLDKLAKEED